MNYRYISVVCAVCLLWSAFAHADEGWYLSGQIGGSFLTSSDLDDPTGIVAAVGTEFDFDPGFDFSGALGYHRTKLRVEAEIKYATNDIDTLEVVGVGLAADGDVSSLGFMLNVFRDFDISDPWQVYLGGGIGYAIVSINDARVVGVALADDDDTVFAYQLGTGIGYRISPATTFSLDYRYFATLNPEFSDVGGAPFEAEYGSNVIRVGVRVNF